MTTHLFIFVKMRRVFQLHPYDLHCGLWTARETGNRRYFCVTSHKSQVTRRSVCQRSSQVKVCQEVCQVSIIIQGIVQLISELTLGLPVPYLSSQSFHEYLGVVGRVISTGCVGGRFIKRIVNIHNQTRKYLVGSRFRRRLT